MDIQLSVFVDQSWSTKKYTLYLQGQEYELSREELVRLYDLLGRHIGEEESLPSSK